MAIADIPVKPPAHVGERGNVGACGTEANSEPIREIPDPDTIDERRRDETGTHDERTGHRHRAGPVAVTDRAGDRSEEIERDA